MTIFGMNTQIEYDSTTSNSSKSVRIIDGLINCANCFAISAMGRKVVLKSANHDYLSSITIDKSNEIHRQQYSIAGKYAKKRWLYLEMINDVDVLALVESSNNWSLITFRLVTGTDDRLMKISRAKTFRQQLKSKTNSVSCRREGNRFRFYIIQSSIVDDTKWCSLLKCEITSALKIVKSLKTFASLRDASSRPYCATKLMVPESAWWNSQVFEIRRRLHFIADSKRHMLYADLRDDRMLEWRKQDLYADTVFGYPINASETPLVEWNERLWMWNRDTNSLWTLDLCSYQWRNTFVDGCHDDGIDSCRPVEPIALRILPNGRAYVHANCASQLCSTKAHIYQIDLQSDAFSVQQQRLIDDLLMSDELLIDI